MCVCLEYEVLKGSQARYLKCVYRVCLWCTYVCVLCKNMCFLTCLRLPCLEDNGSTKILITVTCHLLEPENTHKHTHADLHFKLYTEREMFVCDL